ncbi:MAG TPA: short-chain dehydrogenase [Bacteroidota bacterium]|nr:short-chain dehydrogenase [Bacteroidota bacterium]
MDIKNRTVLVLGGFGLVGSAICRKLVEELPKKIIVTSLLQAEAESAVAELRQDFPKLPKNYFVPWWGNIFVRHDLKDTPREQVLSDEKMRRMFIADTLDELTEPLLHASSLYRLIDSFKPDIIIDSINSATAIAYQDIYQQARDVLWHIDSSKGRGGDAETFAAMERLLCTLYTPQLIRHVQLMYRSMHSSKTKIYIKIGTSGTGGMGLNIPYTHSEERPSSVLLSKSAVAGSHTMLLFLMGRTPDSAITKEIKPTAAIAWKKIGYGEIKRRGKPIDLVDCKPENAVSLKGFLKIKTHGVAVSRNETLKSVFIDTGENGIFSRGEFEAIATPGQMEFVTAEEIAESVVYEIKGGNTGHDIINALDNATLAPTYRAGFLFQSADERIRALEKEHKVASVAFESLGPPRLSKLLYEAHLLKTCYGDFHSILKQTPEKISKALTKKISTDKTLRSQIISIGIPILLPDGKSLLRADEVKVPAFRGENDFPITPKNIDLWAHDGWVDLRATNMKRWKDRLALIVELSGKIDADETGSRYMYRKEYWSNFEDVDPGKIVGWIFSYEEKGMRMKA